MVLKMRPVSGKVFAVQIAHPALDALALKPRYLFSARRLFEQRGKLAPRQRYILDDEGSVAGGKPSGRHRHVRLPYGHHSAGVEPIVAATLQKP